MSKANYWGIHHAGGAGMGAVCVPVIEGVYTNYRSGAAALVTPVFRCHWDLGASY